MLFSVLISFEFNMFWKNVKVHLGAGLCQQSIVLVTNLSLKVENTRVKVAFFFCFFFFFRAVVLNLKSGVAEKYLRVVQEM